MLLLRLHYKIHSSGSGFAQSQFTLYVCMLAKLILDIHVWNSHRGFSCPIIQHTVSVDETDGFEGVALDGPIFFLL